MKKKLIFYILSLIFLLPLPAGAVKKIEANPINIAVMLIHETDTAKIASTCEYYGYTREFQEKLTPDTSKPETFTSFTHPNGSLIRYILPPDQKYPIIEVKSKATPKEKDQTLKNLNFHKTGNTYVRKSIGYTTRCSSGSNGTMILTCHSKHSKE